MSTTVDDRPARRLVNVDPVAERLGVAPAVVWRLAREGKIPYVALGRYRKFDLAAIERWIEQGGAK